MATDVQSVTILTQPVSLEEEDVEPRIMKQPMMRMKNLVRDRSVLQTELKFKPFYLFDATLTKFRRSTDHVVYEGAILVDMMTGISRALLEEQFELEERSVSMEQVIDEDIDEDEAWTNAKSRRMQVEHQEKGDLEMADDYEVVYKPIWLAELSTGGVVAVDAVDGRVVDDFTFQ